MLCYMTPNFDRYLIKQELKLNQVNINVVFFTDNMHY